MAIASLPYPRAVVDMTSTMYVLPIVRVRSIIIVMDLNSRAAPPAQNQSGGN